MASISADNATVLIRPATQTKLLTILGNDRGWNTALPTPTLRKREIIAYFAPIAPEFRYPNGFIVYVVEGSTITATISGTGSYVLRPGETYIPPEETDQEFFTYGAVIGKRVGHFGLSGTVVFEETGTNTCTVNVPVFPVDDTEWQVSSIAQSVLGGLFTTTTYAESRSQIFGGSVYDGTVTGKAYTVSTVLDSPWEDGDGNDAVLSALGNPYYTAPTGTLPIFDPAEYFQVEVPFSGGLAQTLVEISGAVTEPTLSGNKILVPSGIKLSPAFFGNTGYTLENVSIFVESSPFTDLSPRCFQDVLLDPGFNQTEGLYQAGIGLVIDYQENGAKRWEQYLWYPVSDERLYTRYAPLATYTITDEPEGYACATTTTTLPENSINVTGGITNDILVYNTSNQDIRMFVKVSDWEVTPTYVGPGDPGDTTFGGGCKFDDEAFNITIEDFGTGEGILLVTDEDAVALAVSQLQMLHPAELVPTTFTDGQLISLPFNDSGLTANYRVIYPTLPEDVTGLAFRADLPSYSFLGDLEYPIYGGVIQIIDVPEISPLVNQFTVGSDPGIAGLSGRSVVGLVIPLAVDSTGEPSLIGGFNPANTPIRFLGGSINLEVYPLKGTCDVTEGTPPPERPENPIDDSGIDLTTPLALSNYRATYEPEVAIRLRQERIANVVNQFIPQIREALKGAIDKDGGKGRSLPLDMNGFQIKNIGESVYVDDLLRIGGL